MRSTYRVLAYAIPVLVAVQASMIAFGFFGVGSWVEDGHDLTKSVIDNNGSSVTGSAGLNIHGINGQLVIPLVAIVLLIISFFAKIPGGSKWAGFILLDVVVQIALAFVAFGVPAIGILHGLNAFVLAGLGFAAAARVNRVTAASEPEMASS